MNKKLDELYQEACKTFDCWEISCEHCPIPRMYDLACKLIEKGGNKECREE